MKTVLRVETAPGVGIYAGGNTAKQTHVIYNCRRVMEKHFGCLGNDRHPNPTSDSALMKSFRDANESHYCLFCFGFTDVDQFRAWFYKDEVLLDLDKLGVTLVCYEVSQVFAGNTQCCFPRTDLIENNVQWRIPLGQYLKEGLPMYSDIVDYMMIS